MIETPTSQSGNMLFLILIAVALFAALSYAVSTSSRTSGSTIADEKADMAADEILNYVVAIRTAVTRLLASGACNSNSISFENNANPGYEHAGGPNPACMVFHPNGGAVPYKLPNPEWLNNAAHSQWGFYNFSGRTAIQNIGTDGGGANSVELNFVLPFVNSQICTALNRQIGIVNPLSGFTNFSWSAKFKDGNYVPSYLLTDAPYVGKHEGCAGQIFYAVILPR